MAQIRKIFEIKKSIKDPRLARALDMVMNIYDRSYGMRTYVHDILFRETILTHGTPTQFKHWQVRHRYSAGYDLPSYFKIG